MKTVIKITSFAIVALITISACSNSGAKNNKKQVVETKEQAQAPVIKKPASTTFDFEGFALGELPKGWSQFYQGKGGTDWKIVDDNGNKVLAQLYSDNPKGHFNIAVNDSIIAKDMTLTARLKGVTGKHDQGGGFVWRFTDKENYYVVRANPLEDNVVLYKVENGKRSDLPLVGEGRTYGVAVDPLGNNWNTLKLTVKDNLFTVYLNNKQLFMVSDDTFADSGKIGLWSKADAVTFFDDFQITK